MDTVRYAARNNSTCMTPFMHKRDAKAATGGGSYSRFPVDVSYRGERRGCATECHDASPLTQTLLPHPLWSSLACTPSRSFFQRTQLHSCSALGAQRHKTSRRRYFNPACVLKPQQVALHSLLPSTTIGAIRVTSTLPTAQPANADAKVCEILLSNARARTCLSRRATRVPLCSVLVRPCRPLVSNAPTQTPPFVPCPCKLTIKPCMKPRNPLPPEPPCIRPVERHRS